MICQEENEKRECPKAQIKEDNAGEGHKDVRMSGAIKVFLKAKADIRSGKSCASAGK